jgi:hypothetical protein
MNQWDEIESAFAGGPDMTDRVEVLSWRHIEAQEAYERAKANLAEIEASIAALVPPHEGTHVLLGKDRIVTVKYAETITWDTDALSRMFIEPELPPFVKLKPVVDKKLLDAEPEGVKVLVSGAMTRKIGKPKIKVRDRVDV